MIPDWDEDSSHLCRNMVELLRRVRNKSRKRLPPNLASIRDRHTRMMEGLTVPDSSMVGKFRGEKGLRGIRVRIGLYFGVEPERVGAALSTFENELKKRTARLDREVPANADPDARQLDSVLDLCAWAHAEWVRIHPLANGNGRIARLLANSIAMRYGLPPFAGLRPRPDNGYNEASVSAMLGDWRPMSIVFRRNAIRNFEAQAIGCLKNPVSLLHHPQHRLHHLVRGDRLHAAEIERAIAQEAGAAFHVMTQHPVPRSKRARECRFG